MLKVRAIQIRGDSSNRESVLVLPVTAIVGLRADKKAGGTGFDYRLAYSFGARLVVIDLTPAQHRWVARQCFDVLDLPNPEAPAGGDAESDEDGENVPGSAG